MDCMAKSFGASIACILAPFIIIGTLDAIARAVMT